MSFNTIAAAISGKRPFFLYKFDRDGATWQFTSRAQDLNVSVPDVSDDVWKASPIRHGNITDSGRAERSDVEITFPVSDEFAREFLSSNIRKRTRVRIWKGFSNDFSDLALQFTGDVLSSSPSATEIKLTCKTEIASLDHRGLAAVIQRPCRHVLYGRGCNLNIEDFFETGNLSFISDNGLVVAVDIAQDQPDGFYSGGEFRWNGVSVMITAHIESALSLHARVPGLVDAFDPEDPEDFPVEIAPGCPRTLTACRDKFNNLNNFGGFPYILDNPFETGVD